MTKQSEIIRRIPTEEQIAYAKSLIDTEEKPWRGSFDGNYYQKLFGLTAQVVIQDLLGLDRPKRADGFDGGYDFEHKFREILKSEPWISKFGKHSIKILESVIHNYKFDVKCELRSVSFKVKEFVHNVTASQLDYIADAFIFCSYNRSKGVLEICGWCTKEEFKNRASFYKKGSIRKRSDGSILTLSADNYEIENKWLRPFEELLW